MIKKALKTVMKALFKTKRRSIISSSCILVFIFITSVMASSSWFLTKDNFFDIDESKNQNSGIYGTEFVDALIKITENMHSNWMVNDLLWPTVFIDNAKNYQLGQLEAIRYSIRVLRDNLSRMRTTDKIDYDVEKAFEYISNNAHKWWFPSFESRLALTIKHLKSYKKRLITKEARFYPRGDNFIELLNQYTSLMGGVNTRLSNALEKKEITSVETGGDEFINGEKKIHVRTPWNKVDDNFYYARGVGYVLREMMLTIYDDFRPIIEIKKTNELVERIIEVLSETQLWPIVVMNRKRNSIFANHSSPMQALLEDARQKMNSLASMLDR